MATQNGWIGFDFDGTLAVNGPEPYSDDVTGDPYPEMVALAKSYIAQGYEVRICTARGSEYQKNSESHNHVVQVLQDWSEKHIGQRLAVVHGKDYNMKILFDDRARQCIEGRVVYDRIQQVEMLIEVNNDLQNLVYAAMALLNDPDVNSEKIIDWTKKAQRILCV